MKSTKSKLVIVRSYGSGVTVGELFEQQTSGGYFVVTLKNARRLWRWKGANTLFEVARHGVSEDYTRLSDPLDTIQIAEVCEVIPVEESAAASLVKSRWAP